MERRRRWEDNIKVDLTDIGSENVAWDDLAQDTVQWQVLVNSAMNLRVP
jgi:hypothetical protein